MPPKQVPPHVYTHAHKGQNCRCLKLCSICGQTEMTCRRGQDPSATPKCPECGGINFCTSWCSKNDEPALD